MPFQMFKLEVVNDISDMDSLQKKMFELMLYFQKLALSHYAAASALKKSNVAYLFIKQVQEASVRVTTREQRDHMKDLEALVKASPHFNKPPTQSLFEKKMQEKLRKAEKMLTEYGFSFREACKEAKVSRPTVKKWLAKQQRKEAEAVYKLPKQAVRPPKQFRLRAVKKFIDEREGNVFIKDIRCHLQTQGLGIYSEQTLGYWIKRNLGYTYKKASTLSPDIRKVELVTHQAHVAGLVRDAANFGLYFIYIDETAFTRNEGKSYGFAPKGQRLSFTTHKPAYSIGGIAAMSAFRLEAF